MVVRIAKLLCYTEKNGGQDSKTIMLYWKKMAVKVHNFMVLDTVVFRACFVAFHWKIWFCVCEVACRSLWRPWLAKPSFWKWSPQTLLKMWRPRFRIKKAFPQTSSVLSLLASSWRMAALCLTTTSRRSPLSTWCCVSVVAAHFRLF